jgi:hypothetical protein
MWFMDYPTKDTILTSLLMASPRWCWKGFVVFFFFTYSHTEQKLKTPTKCSTEEHQLLTYIKYKQKIIITDIPIILTDMITDIQNTDRPDYWHTQNTDRHEYWHTQNTDRHNYWHKRLLPDTITDIKYWQTQLLTYQGYWPASLIYKTECMCVCVCVFVPGRLANRCTDPRQTWPGGSSPPRNRSAGRRDMTSPTMTSRRPRGTAEFAWNNRRKFGNCPIRAKLGVEVPPYPEIVLRVGAMWRHRRWRHGGRTGWQFLLEKILEHSETVRSVPILAWMFLATPESFCG